MRRVDSLAHNLGLIFSFPLLSGIVGPLGVGTPIVHVGADGEDNGEQELQLLLGHGLQVHAIVVRLDAGRDGLVARNRGREGRGVVRAYLKRLHRWKGHTHVALVMRTVEMPMPVTARYSSGAAIL